MRILITNTALAGRTGTEIFVAQLAGALRSRGHDAVLYSPLVGELGLGLRAAGHFVFDRIADITPAPDVIHAHHVGPTLAALAAFPGTPAIFLMHSVEAEFDAPPLHPQIVSYHAVSSFIRAQRASAALPAPAIGIIRNAVDLDAFPLQSAPRPRAERALAVAKFGAGRDVLRAACSRLCLAYDEVGPGAGRVVSGLPDAFAASDIVFASGRSALEAMASGRAVVLTDNGRFGGLIRRETAGALLDLNLGVRAMPHRLTVLALEAAIGGYDAADALAVACHVREVASLEKQADALLGLYADAIRRGVQAGDRDRRLAALIEAYVPSHGALPWRELARWIATGSLRPQLNALAETRGFALSDEPLEHLTPGLHRFAAGNPACHWLASGWWEPEDWGVWSDAAASLQMPVAPDVTQITIHYTLFENGAGAAERPVLRIGGIDGRRIVLTEAPVRRRGVREVTFDVLPADSCAEPLSLTFLAPCAKSAKDADPRRLGVGLIALTAR